MNIEIWFGCNPFKLHRKCFEASFHQLGQEKAQLWALSPISSGSTAEPWCPAGTRCHLVPPWWCHHPRAAGRGWQCPHGSVRTDPEAGSPGLSARESGGSQGWVTCHAPGTPFYAWSGPSWPLDPSSVVPQGAQGKMSMESHYMHEIKGWTMVFNKDFFFMLLLWELMLHWLSGMFSDLHSCSFGKNVSRMRACVSGHVQTSLLYNLPPPKETWTVLLHGYDPVMFQQIIQNTLVI